MLVGSTWLVAAWLHWGDEYPTSAERDALGQDSLLALVLQLDAAFGPVFLLIAASTIAYLLGSIVVYAAENTLLSVPTGRRYTDRAQRQLADSSLRLHLAPAAAVLVLAVIQRHGQPASPLLAVPAALAAHGALLRFEALRSEAPLHVPDSAEFESRFYWAIEQLSAIQPMTRGAAILELRRLALDSEQHRATIAAVINRLFRDRLEAASTEPGCAADIASIAESVEHIRSELAIATQPQPLTHAGAGAFGIDCETRWLWELAWSGRGSRRERRFGTVTSAMHSCAALGWSDWT